MLHCLLSLCLLACLATPQRGTHGRHLTCPIYPACHLLLCNLNLNLGQIYVAFELGAYYQNFRRYVRSFDPARMHDGGNKSSPAAACDPFSYLGPNSTLPINPCGQIAHSFFNDTFQLAIAGGPGGGAAVPLELDESNIAWATDREDLYGAVPAENYNPGGALAAQRGGNTSAALLNQNEHWMVSLRGCSTRAPAPLHAL